MARSKDSAKNKVGQDVNQKIDEQPVAVNPAVPTLTQAPAKLTEIAKRLKETFTEYQPIDVSENINEELRRLRTVGSNESNGDKSDHEAELILVGDLYYIVVNGKYKIDTSGSGKIFSDSLKSDYAIIDADTSSVLIDEVYSRITYMRRDCKTNHNEDDKKNLSEEFKNNFSRFISPGDKIGNSTVNTSGENEDNFTDEANIFQCHLLKDTGVSAASDTYNFMLKRGMKPQKISPRVMQNIGSSGTVSMLKEQAEIDEHKGDIQEAIYDEYAHSDIDIASVTVKSIFEIRISCGDATMKIEDARNGYIGKYTTSYLAGKKNEFKELNQNLFRCNCCKNELIDPLTNEESHVHVNIDAYARESEANSVYAVGCDSCLERCKVCGGYHFNYRKLGGSKFYADVNFIPGRDAIMGMEEFDEDINYCLCREGIEWVYDQKAPKTLKFGKEIAKNALIPIETMVFLNLGNEVIATYEDFRKFIAKTDKTNSMPGRERIKKFKNELQSRFDIRESDITITSISNCWNCEICHGAYYITQGDTRTVCDICKEMTDRQLHMVTRNDGIVFLRSKTDKYDKAEKKRYTKTKITKYRMTRFGNLKPLETGSLDVEKYKEETKKKAVKPETVNREISEPEETIAGIDDSFRN